jgi:hypothetical protein
MPEKRMVRVKDRRRLVPKMMVSAADHGERGTIYVGGMPPGFTTDHIHPMRHLRRFPEAAVRSCPTGTLDMEAYERLSNDVTNAYNAVIEKLPFTSRLANLDAGAQALSDLGHLISFTAAGRNTFLLTSEMLDLFDHTDLGDIRLSDIHFPFRAF